MNTIWILLGLIALALIIPPRFDPAMRLKEWAERRNNDHV